jgi:hypothetical protein
MQKLKRPDLSSRIGSILGSLQGFVSNRLLPVRLWPKSLTTIALVGICLLVLLMCSGCHPVRPELPHQADPRPLPPFSGKTYRDALQYIPELRESFLACEADKRTIRKVMEGEGDE